MPSTVIIGGGLSGLIAALSLQEQGLDYTLIEVKDRLGGSITSRQQDGYIFDGSLFAVDQVGLLADYGLAGDLYPLERGFAFRHGAGALIDALGQRVTGAVLHRMAVSSIGQLDDGRCALCMENGLMLDADAIIIAAPARYAERMFYGYIPEASALLRQYRYDSVLRVSLGYAPGAIRLPVENPPDMLFPFILATDHPTRTPDGGVMLHIGVRFPPDSAPDAVVDLVTRMLDLPAPSTSRVDYWPEADPVTIYDADHRQRMADLRSHLPERVVLTGSDYGQRSPAHQGVVHLDDRIQQARDAAVQVASRLS